MKSSARRAIWAFITFIVLMLGLAIYGWYTGAWDDKPLPSGYGTPSG
jgi:hypothetical protein